MVRFGTNHRRPVRNYSSWREQLRLLALFVPLALVILMMGRLREPKTAAAIDTLFAQAKQQDSIVPRPLVEDAPSPRSPVPFPGIRADLLKTIEDNTYFRTAEKDAWFHFFELIQKGAADKLRGVPVEYAQLVDQPNVYRGKLVTVRGTARTITQEKPADNNLGLKSYYRVVIQPEDGANWPFIVYCLELPKDVSVGDELSIEVNATGLFFKKLSYKWRDGLGIAPVIITNSISVGERISMPSAIEKQSPTKSALSKKAKTIHDVTTTAEMQDAEQTTGGQAAFQKILNLSGWDAARLAKFDDGHPLSDAQRIEAFELLRRLRSIDSASLSTWSGYPPNDLPAAERDTLIDKLFDLEGRLTKVTRRSPPTADATRLEMPEYFECEIQLTTLPGTATLLTTRVPKDFLRGGELNEPVSANALLIKWFSKGEPPTSLWLTKEVQWYPGFSKNADGSPNSSVERFVDSPDPLLGKSLLGALAVDLGQLDLIEGRGRIRSQERDIFYQMLSAVGEINVSTLVRVAKDNLPTVKQEWGRLSEKNSHKRSDALAREIVRRADTGTYSVALLFNDPEPQIGRLFVFDGVARRAVRVEVGGTADAQSSDDIANRFGFDHYYELEFFTSDSQNYPLIFCVRELPNGFPIGADIHVPVRVAGFFFKNWLYSTRGRGQSDEPGDAKATGPQAQFAPLLIGPAPILLETATAHGRAGQYVLGGLFVLAFAGIWAAAAWFSRDDRLFRERTPAANYELPAGQSLNDLNLPAADVPMIDLAVQQPTSDSSD